MRLNKMSVIILACMVLALGLVAGGCFNNTRSASQGGSITPTVMKPLPKVDKVVSTTTGTQTAYYCTLDITVKNEGSEGTILVQAAITQAGKTDQSEMPVFLKQGESHELKLTFPLVWGGGEPTYNVEAIIP